MKSMAPAVQSLTLFMSGVNNTYQHIVGESCQIRDAQNRAANFLFQVDLYFDENWSLIRDMTGNISPQLV